MERPQYLPTGQLRRWGAEGISGVTAAVYVGFRCVYSLFFSASVMGIRLMLRMCRALIVR